MRFRISRFYGFGVPLGCMAAAIFGQPDSAALLFTLYLSITVCSLSAAEAFRIAAAKLISDKKILFSAIAAAVMLSYSAYVAPSLVLPKFFPSLGERGAHGNWGFVALELGLLRILVELAAARNDLTSALLGDLLSGMAVAAGILLFPEMERQIDACMIALGVLMLLMLALSFRKEMPRNDMQIFKEIPVAMLRTALFPAVYLLLTHKTLVASLPVILNPLSSLAWNAELLGLALGLYAGCCVVELSRATFRRNEMESREFNLALTGAMFVLASAKTAAVLLNPALSGVLQGAFNGIVLAAGCALALYGPLKPRILAAAALLMLPSGASLLLSGKASFLWATIIADAMTIPAVVCMIPDAIFLHRGAKARRIRNRAMKKRL